MTPVPPSALPSDVLRDTAFSSDPGGGNPAGVVLDASACSDADMLATAAEVGYSETAFVTAGDAGARRFTLRYFSPLAEVGFCGHATVATSVALAERIGPGRLVFETPVGEIPVMTSAGPGGSLRATLTSVPTRSRPADEDELKDALAALHWERRDLDPALEPHVSFAGNDHLVLVAATRSRLADLAYDFDALAEVMRRYGWTTVHLVWRESSTLFHVRDPFPVGGVVEDPATGAAAAAFGGYLRVLGLVTGRTTVTLRQGEDMGRPGELLVEVDASDSRVRVSGEAVPLAG